MVSPSSLEKGLSVTPSEVKGHNRVTEKTAEAAGDKLLAEHNSREPEPTVSALKDRENVVVTANLVSSKETPTSQAHGKDIGFRHCCCNCNCTKSLEPEHEMEVKNFGLKPLEAWDVRTYKLVLVEYAKFL